MINLIKQSIQSSIEAKEQILESDLLIQNIHSVAELLVSAFETGHKVWFCGNGGSAADAQHIAAELSGRFNFDRPPLAAEAMHVNTSYLTAVANDYGYHEVYARYLRGLAQKGDVLFAISTSGNSENILKAIEVAHQMGVSVVTLTGMTGGKMKSQSDICLGVPSNQTPRIQESHIMIGHIVCELIELKMFHNYQIKKQ